MSLKEKNRSQLTVPGPGMIIALAKLKETATGDTLCDAANPVVLDAPEPLNQSFPLP